MNLDRPHNDRPTDHQVDLLGLGERPALSTPPELRPTDLVEAERYRRARQPGLGLRGVLLVVPITLILGFGAGGLEASLQLFGPISTFALPLVIMTAFLWNNWPGTRLRPGWSGLVDAIVVILGGIALTFLGQYVVYGRVDATGVFVPGAPASNAPTFPVIMSLAATVFVVMLELTMVSEGWPFTRLQWLAAGLTTLVFAWLTAIGVYFTVMQTHPLPGSHLRLLNGPMTGAELASLLIAIGCWQVWFYVSLRGWPFSGINSCAQRLATANVSVLGAGLLTYFTIRQLGGPAEAISSCGGVFIAAVLLQGMLFEGWPHAPDDPSRDWRIALGFSVVLAAALFGLFTALAGTATWTTAKPSQWVAYAGLNAIGMGVVLHVALGRRWPFDPASRQ